MGEMKSDAQVALECACHGRGDHNAGSNIARAEIYLKWLREQRPKLTKTGVG